VLTPDRSLSLSLSQETKLTPEHREAITGVLQDWEQIIYEGVSKSRGVSQNAVRDIFGKGPHTALSAKKQQFGTVRSIAMCSK